MSARTIVSIDAMGGDRGPGPLIEALAELTRRHEGLGAVLHGPEPELAPLLARHPGLAARARISHAEATVDMDALPADALRGGRTSSMWQALAAVRRGEAGAALSAGNTGALLAMSVRLLKKAQGVARPAIAVHWPADRPQGYKTVLDVGADIRAEPGNLAQFAVMGAEYARLSFDHPCPSVGLLNLGTEPSKGPDWLHAAARLTEQAADASGRFSYAGFVEGTDLSAGPVDVIVTDGFTGNIALKAAEGTAAFVGETLRRALTGPMLARLGALLARGALRQAQRRIDPRRVNGGVFLGLGGAVVKSHGSADAVGFCAALDLARRMAESELSVRVASHLRKLDMT